jgi:hypothetical protein
MSMRVLNRSNILTKIYSPPSWQYSQCAWDLDSGAGGGVGGGHSLMGDTKHAAKLAGNGILLRFTNINMLFQ